MLTELEKQKIKILISNDNSSLEDDAESGKIIYQALKKTKSTNYQDEVNNWINYLEQYNFKLDCWALPDARHDLYVVYK